MPQDPFEQENPDSKEKVTKHEKHRRAVDTIRRFMKRSDEYRKPFLEHASRARELYQCWELQSRSITQRANLRLPYAYLIIESEFPQLTEIFLKDPCPIKFRGRSSDDMPFQNDLSDFAAMQFVAMKFPARFLSFSKGLLIDGTAIAKVPYKFKEMIVKKQTVVTDSLGIQWPQKTEELETLHDGPDFVPIKLDDFFPDWSSRLPGDIDAMRGCVYRFTNNFSELEAKKKFYSNLEEVRYSIDRKGSNAWADPYYKIDANSNGAQNENEKKKPIEMWEYWGLFDAEGNGKFEEYLIVVANGDVVVRCEPNFYNYKFKPFVAAVNVVIDHEFYGLSEVMAVRGLIKEATAIRNSRLDQVSLAVNRMFIVDRAGGVTANSLYSRPNGIIWANDVNAIKPLEPPEVTASSFREVSEITNEIQAVAGSNAGPGLTDAGRVFGRSATGASFVSNIAGSRVAAKARALSEIFFKPLAKVMMMTNAQFVTENQWVRVSDPNRPSPFSMLPASAFHCDYDFEVVTSLEADSAKEFQNMQMFIQFAQVAEQTQPGTIKWAQVYEAVGRQLLGNQSKNFVRSDEERMQLMAQQGAAEQMANAQMGATAPGTGIGK